jgi:hypothetical protein
MENKACNLIRPRYAKGAGVFAKIREQQDAFWSRDVIDSNEQTHKGENFLVTRKGDSAVLPYVVVL